MTTKDELAELEGTLQIKAQNALGIEGYKILANRIGSDAVKARDAELLEEIKPLIITGAGARNENSAGWNIAIETVIRILSPPKPEEKKILIKVERGCGMGCGLINGSRCSCQNKIEKKGD